MDFFYKYYEQIRKYFLDDQCYFFLPIISEYNTSLTLTSIVQNSTKFYKFKNLYARVWYFEKKKNCWVNLKNFYFANKNVLQIFSKDFIDYKEKSNLLLVSLDSSIRNKYSVKLPISFIKKIDFSPHTLRGKHSFIKNNVSSGYMGEYPVKMTKIGSGNTFSYINMFHSQPLKSKSTIVFINFSEYSNEKGKLLLIDVDENRVIFSKKTNSNQACTISLDNKSFFGKKIVLFSLGHVGIPIYINEYRANMKYTLSVEHSHPPSEYFFSDVYKYQALLKRNWLKNYEEIF